MSRAPVAIIGAGFTGLAAAYELTKRGHAVQVFEADQQVGGLAGSFTVDGRPLEKFYHHWFTNDRHVLDLVRELGREQDVLRHASRTGMYYANSFFRLSSPLDVLRFTPLNLIDRLRLGLLVLRVRQVRDWRALEALTAEEWLLRLCGRNVYRVVWEPLLRGKFGEYAREVSAVWFWNKLKLRGGSRGKGGAETLAYFRGGFAALAEAVRQEIVGRGGCVRLGEPVRSLSVEHGRVRGIATDRGVYPAAAVIATPALPIIAGLLEEHAGRAYADELRRIDYLGNVCLVLELDRSLSDTYWLNVNDPSFPFVGVIEHTNFESPASYGGRHIVYLSKYLPVTDELYRMSDEEALAYCLPFLRRMFPAFDPAWILAHHVWREPYAQPVVTRHYSRRIPASETPVEGLYLSTMAQIYPEDRGTNYAIREGRRIASFVADRHPR